MLEQVKKFLLKVNKNVVVAYSGGLDSCALLHIVNVALKDTKLKLRAVHVNHNLSPNANAWQGHCNHFCAKLNIKFSCFSVNLDKKNRQSLEEVARKARYQVLLEDLKDDEVLLTAHHQDDVAETFLLQALRGSGAAGLSAIADVKQLEFNNKDSIGTHNSYTKEIIRPLLEYSRKELEEYVVTNNLEYIEDESNLDTSFKRNFLRHNVLPLLEQNYSGAISCLARSAKHCSSANTLTQELAEIDIGKLGSSSSLKNRMDSYYCISYNYLLTLSDIRALNTIRYWLQDKVLMPSSAKLNEFWRQLKDIAEDKHPEMIFGDYYLKAYNQHLYLGRKDKLALAKDNINKSYKWKLSYNDFLDNTANLSVDLACTKLNFKEVSANEKAQEDMVHTISLSSGKSIELEVRFNYQGLSFIQQNKQKIGLKELYRLSSIAPWMRACVPLLYLNGQLLGPIAENIVNSINIELGNSKRFTLYSFINC